MSTQAKKEKKKIWPSFDIEKNDLKANFDPLRYLAKVLYPSHKWSDVKDRNTKAAHECKLIAGDDKKELWNFNPTRDVEPIHISVVSRTCDIFNFFCFVNCI